MDRRTFLATVAATVVVPASHADEKFTVIDTHTHFYDPSRPEGVPWPSKDDPVLYRTILPADYAKLKQVIPVTGTVVVEASPLLEDNQWLLDLAAKEKFIVGIVGNLTPGSPDFAKHIKRFSMNKLYRGIRIGHGLIQKAERKPLLADLSKLVDADLALDINGGPTMLPDVIAVAKELPKLRIVVNHMSNVRINGKAPPKEWQTNIQRVAELPTVFCKMSALVEGTGHTDGKAPANVEFYQPTLDVLWKAFGAERLMYGSNWPVSERFAPCETVQKLVIDYCDTKEKDAKQKVLATTSAKAYKWVQR